MTKLLMNPAPGDRVLRFVGDHTLFTLRFADQPRLPDRWQAYLRTNLTRATALRQEIIHAHARGLPPAGPSWRDVPMRPAADQWLLELPLAETGYFRAKAYAVDPQGRQHWPDGPDAGITVHPDSLRTGNTVYCAFVRLFGSSRPAANWPDTSLEGQIKELDNDGYTVIPASGKLRDLTQQLPHIMDTLGCRIIHLLPVNPTPTTYARFGRYGSPYASLDFTAIDPALVVFDQRTTAEDQFRELTWAVHNRGGLVLLDLAINHTGWGAQLQENHPDWYLRNPDGSIASPGAWGVTWEDLCELKHNTTELWDYLTDVFLVWRRRGVDGFRCDAGYKVPVQAWQYITARVQNEFPGTVFLLEGLGGPWETTETLLTEGGMQWAYSELFQNIAAREVATYLDYSLRQSQRAGLWIHYSETHDNNRLAAQGRAWSLLRNRLCALTSLCGGFGFTSGVEWLAAQKIDVHSCAGLRWDNPDNIVVELGRSTKLLAEHPCFFDGANLKRLSPIDSPVYALQRNSAEGADRVLVLINTDAQNRRAFAVERKVYRELEAPAIDLLGQKPPDQKQNADGSVTFSLVPAACFCLSADEKPRGLSGQAYRRARAKSAWALAAMCHMIAPEQLGHYDWRALADLVEKIGAKRFLAALNKLDRQIAAQNPVAALKSALEQPVYPSVTEWEISDRQRIVPVPPGHWLLLSDTSPFRCTLAFLDGSCTRHGSSTLVAGVHIACFAPGLGSGSANLSLERYAPDNKNVQGQLLFLTPEPVLPTVELTANKRFLGIAQLPEAFQTRQSDWPTALLTNDRGGMARICIDLGRVQSKYDCLLAANLDSRFPVDRHVLAKRVRVWLNADGFISPLDGQCLAGFSPGPPAHWRFLAGAGDGRAVEVHLVADMLDQRNTTVLRFKRPAQPPPFGNDLPDRCDVRLTIRVDIEDRNFHTETHRNPAAEHHFSSNCRRLSDRPGFEFTPAADRALRVFASAGEYNHEAEWSQNIPHPVEQSRGQVASGDAYSHGWFDLPLPKGTEVTVVVCADSVKPMENLLQEFPNCRTCANELAISRAELPPDDLFGQQLVIAVQAFLARRNKGKTLIAGYPWFLDWGRDSLICARGLLAAGMVEVVKELLAIFGQFEQDGTLPNSIHGADASNRDTTDAPLWYGLVCEETAAIAGPTIYDTVIGKDGRTVKSTLVNIARGYLHGTPNRIQVDHASGLVWSPAHFTWMDTNYPACTPRQGYPIEVQALWIRLLRQLERLDKSTDVAGLADLADASLHKLFWLEDKGYMADLLIAEPGTQASAAAPDSALRSNCLMAISLGLVTGERAQRCVEAAARYLLVPGALRSLAPLPVSPPLPVYSNDGRLLNNPHFPYCGRYQGDEDTQRKPAYHNGTAWTWTLPGFSEALAKAWDFDAKAVDAAKAYLTSTDGRLLEGCIGQLPEILDGDAPHTQRGCDAQAWSVTETLRVWKLIAGSGSRV